MGNNASLSSAKSKKDDEYYTLYEDISSELPKYKEQLKGKRIICPCDWDESYNEELVYKEEGVSASELFSFGSIKHLDITASKERIEKDFDKIKCNFVKFLVAHAETYGIKSISVSGYNPKTGEGVKFQDVNYSNYDLVITNPPFSAFQEFVHTMMKNNMEFLIIGPLVALAYKDMFTYIQGNRMWLGYAKQLVGFERPNGDILLSKNPEGSVPRACKWYTNLDVTYRHDKMILTESYYENPDNYPKYINYDAIDVNKVASIPFDYEGKMGVPTTFITKYNPEQFEIIGISGIVAEKPRIKLPKNQQGGPAFYTNIKGKISRKFTKLVIRNLHPEKRS